MRPSRLLPLFLASLLAASLLAACKMGPNFTAPDAPVPDHFAGAAKTDVPPVAGEPAAGSFWWQEFHDPELDSLEKRAIAGNLDLQAAYVRIVEARIQVQSARAQGLPSLAANASVNREQLGVAGILKSQHIAQGATTSATQQNLIGSLEKPISLVQLGFDASWELDLFGKVRRSVEAADAGKTVAIEARNDLLVSLEAEVAQNYLQLRAAQLLAKIAGEQIAAQQDVLDLTRSRYQHGLAGEADVESARSQLANLQSQLPPYAQTVAASRHALAVLIGEAPATLDGEFGEAGDLPPMPSAVPVGIPSQLARRRPDIRESEASLHAATAEVGISVASVFPDVSLSGTLGLRNLGTGYLFNWDSHFYSFAPTVSVPIFQGGALVANIRLSKAKAAEAALSYRKTVLNALQEVEDGLDNLEHDAQRVAALKDAAGASQRALQVNLDAYQHGLITYITVLTVQLQAVQARQQVAQAQLTQSTDLVRLYKALGGGWQDAAPAQADNLETR